MTLKETIKTENLFVHGQSVEADVWNRLLNKHCKQSRMDTTCDSKSNSLERFERIRLRQLFLKLFVNCFQNACYDIGNHSRGYMST